MFPQRVKMPPLLPRAGIFTCPPVHTGWRVDGRAGEHGAPEAGGTSSLGHDR